MRGTLGRPTALSPPTMALSLPCRLPLSPRLNRQPALWTPSSPPPIASAARSTANQHLRRRLKSSRDGPNAAAPQDLFFSQDQWRIEQAKCGHVLDAGRVAGDSDVLVVLGSEAFMDRLCLRSPSSAELLHFSLPVLATVKERHDDVRCWHVESTHFDFPSGPFDVAFLHHCSAFYQSPSHLFSAVVAVCKPDSRIILSYPRGKHSLTELRKQEPNFLLSDLPSLKDLESLLSSLPMEVVSHEDNSDFYLAVIKVTKNCL